MSEIVWGNRIAVSDPLPSWLDDKDIVNPAWRNEPYGCGVEWHRVVCKKHLTNIALPADHFAYLAIAKGFEPWGGGDSPPEDWDSGYVLCRDGREGGGFRWKHDCGQRDIIGYKRKPTAIDGDYVSVKRMTEEEVIDGRFRQYSTYGPLTAITEAFRDLGLIREPTQAETIATKTGLTVDQVQSVLNEANNGTR